VIDDPGSSTSTECGSDQGGHRAKLENVLYDYFLTSGFWGLTILSIMLHADRALLPDS
jgi:hypothetical protein